VHQVGSVYNIMQVCRSTKHKIQQVCKYSYVGADIVTSIK